MKCERALEILESVNNNIDIITSHEEILELMNFHLVTEIKLKSKDKPLEYDLRGLKGQYIRATSGIRDLYKNLVSMEGDLERISFFRKLLSSLKMGYGNELKREIKELKEIIENKELEANEIKKKILETNSEKEEFERAVRVNGMNVVLTPVGSVMIDEIRARRRFLHKELKELDDILKKLDSEFTTIINQVGKIMATKNFSAIWALYLINIDRINLANYLDRITMSEYSYNTAQKKMIGLTFSVLNEPDVAIPKRKVSKIYEDLRYKTRQNNPKDELYKLLFKIQSHSDIRRASTAISLLGKLFAIRTEADPTSITDVNQYLGNLEILVDFRSNLPMIGKETLLYNHLKNIDDEEMIHVLLILALSTNLDAYNYFYKLMKDVPEGSRFFSSVCTLFPWDPEETWMIMLRAQSNILKTQSAKFIPELIEYSLLMSLNPRVLSIANNITKEELHRWQTLIIPIIQLSIYSYLENDLETFIRRRPLAYIVGPRYFIRSSLHYHVIG